MISLRGGRFRILGPLGEGAQGRTFDGVDAREGRPVAIKRFDVRGASAWKDVELAEREARVLQSLSHPKLPRYVDRFEEDGALYLAMEKIEGENLAVIRKRGGALGQRDVERLLHDAAEVLAYLHGRSPPVIHRDLKPGNVIRRPDGSFAFVDFGAVRDKLRPEGGSTVVGTFGFMAPEQFQGRALPASDVYAVGATAVAMLTGREPEQLPHKGLALDVRSALAGRADDRMIAVLEKMLEPDPDRRAGSIAPLLAQLKGPPGRNARRRTQETHPPWPPDARERFEQEVRHWASKYERKRARKEAHRQARRAKREARRRQRSTRVVPWPFSMVLAILFTVSIVMVSFATQLVIPLVLLALSVVFGRAMREAAEAVRDAGKSAVDGIHRSRQWLRGELQAQRGDGAEGPPARVAEDGEALPPDRFRVRDDAARDGDEDAPALADEESWPATDRRARR
jgi:serine/threonine protein kinase